MADFTTLVFQTLVAPAGKLLVKHFCQDPAAEFGGGAVDFLTGQAAAALSGRDQLKVQSYIADLAAGIVEQLQPVFDGEYPDDLNPEAVTFELQTALEAPNLARLMVQQHLDAKAVLKAIAQHRPVADLALSSAERQLYQRALGRLVPGLVEIANQLPSFDVAHARETLSQLARLAEQGDAILAKVEPIADIASLVEELVDHQRHQIAQAEDATTAFERDYIAALRKQLNGFDLMGLADREETEALALDIAYIQLNVNLPGSRGNDPLALPFDRLLARLTPDDRGCLVEGPAGSGKTTLLRWAAINAGRLDLGKKDLELQEGDSHEISLEFFETTDDHFEIRVKPPGRYDDVRQHFHRILAKGYRTAILNYAFERSWLRRIPFFIRLRDCVDGKLPPLSAYAQLTTENTLRESPPDWMQRILADQRALIIWDGLDEVPNRQRRDLLRAIGGVMDNHPGNLFLLSSRPGMRPAQLADLKLQVAEIRPMAVLDVQQFIERWHEAAAHVLRQRHSERAHHMADEGAALSHRLHDELAVLRLAANPLLCSAICSLNYEEKGYLPDEQARLCERLCEMLG